MSFNFLNSQKKTFHGPFLFERVLARRGFFVMDPMTLEQYNRAVLGGNFKKVLTDEMGMQLKNHPNGLVIIRPDVFYSHKNAENATK